MKLRNNLADNLEFVQTTDSALLALPAAPLMSTITLAGTLTIPAITAATRSVLTITLGNFGNPTNLLVGFYLSSIADATILKGLPSFTTGQVIVTSLFSDGYYPANQYMILVSENYTRSMRLTAPKGDTNEVSATGTPLAYGKNYTDIGANMLFGFYGLAAGGAFAVDKKIYMESCWLTQSGSNTVLNIALYNTDVAANASKTVKVAVIR